MKNKAETNSFEESCYIHSCVCNIYCPQCDRFRCSKCNDAHSITGDMLNSEQIYTYLCIVTHNIDAQLALHTKEKLEQQLKESIQTITNTYQKLIEKINICFPGDSRAISSFNQLNKLLEQKGIHTKLLRKNNAHKKVLENFAESGNKISNAIINLCKTELAHQSESTEAPPPVYSKIIEAKYKDQIKSNIETYITSAKFFQSSYPKQIVYYHQGYLLVTYHPILKKKTTLRLNRNIDSSSDSIAFYNRIFIIGGNLNDNTFEVDINNKCLNEKDSLRIKKYSHTLCINRNFIYSIGGCNGKAINDCEKYNINSNLWAQLPDLNEPRQLSAAFSFNNQYIYAFCGMSDKYLNSMERIKISKPAHWENIFIKTPIAIRSNVHGIQINNKQVVIIGGCGNNDNALKETVIVSFKNDAAYCEEGMKLVAASEFYRCVAPSLISNNIYAIDHIKRIHIFKAMKWEMISQ